jgi:transketolase
MLAGLPPGFAEAPGPALELACGMALAERKLASRFGRSLVDHRIWAFDTGADVSRGSVQEAALLAGNWRLGRLTAFIPVQAPDAPGLSAFTAAGWSVRRVNEAEAPEVAAAMSAALRSQKPTLIACLPHSGCGERLGDLSGGQGVEAWSTTGRRVATVRRGWLKRLARHGRSGDYDAAMSGRLPAGWHNAVLEPGTVLAPGQTVMSTAETLRRALVRLAPSLPEFCVIQSEERDKHGQLTQGFAHAMAGMALHGGMIPVGVHELDEAESVRPGLRAAAVAGLRMVACLIEPKIPCRAGGQRAGLRAMRNLFVFRPADATEALECAELALRRSEGPSVLLLCEATVKLLAPRPSRTRCAKGGYVFCEAEAPRAVTMIASGPDLHEVLLARGVLAQNGVAAAVVSLPCWEYFILQDSGWQDAVLGDAPRVAVEAGSGFGWERFLGPGGLFIGPDQVAPGELAAPTARRIADLVLRHLDMRPHR